MVELHIHGSEPSGKRSIGIHQVDMLRRVGRRGVGKTDCICGYGSCRDHRIARHRSSARILPRVVTVERQLLTRLTGPLGNGAIGERRATVRDLRIVRKLGSVRGCGTP